MKYLLPLMCVICFMACQTEVSIETTEDSKSFNAPVLEMEIRNMFNEYHLAVSKDGLTAEFDFLDSSDQFFWAPPGYVKPLDYDSVRSILLTNSKGVVKADYITQTPYQW